MWNNTCNNLSLRWTSLKTWPWHKDLEEDTQGGFTKLKSTNLMLKCSVFSVPVNHRPLSSWVPWFSWQWDSESFPKVSPIPPRTRSSHLVKCVVYFGSKILSFTFTLNSNSTWRGMEIIWVDPRSYVPSSSEGFYSNFNPMSPSL